MLRVVVENLITFGLALIERAHPLSEAGR
jgi:hypothetical protein